MPHAQQEGSRPERRAAQDGSRSGNVRSAGGRRAADLRARRRPSAGAAIFSVLRVAMNGVMVVVEHVYTDADLPEAARSFARDTITLGWEDRNETRGRRRTDAGIGFAISLPRGTVLHAGDCLVLDAVQVVAAVVEQPEPVFVIRPRTAAEWALYAYQIGNRHQPLMITDEALVCPDIPGVEQMLERHRMPFIRQVQAFRPAVIVAGHRH